MSNPPKSAARARPAAWAQLLFASSLLFAGVSVFLIAAV
jgi:hypothetical protein